MKTMAEVHGLVIYDMRSIKLIDIKELERLRLFFEQVSSRIQEVVK